MATDNKYDRQLRLWGSNGQKALMEAHILVIHAGPTGTETLKNLVLPGVGRFTILDSAMVDERDLGNNFFVTEEHLGRPRAQVTCELLLEMNPDVQGDFLVGDLSTLVADDPAFFSKFSLVIAAQTPIEPLQALASVCWTRSIPLIVCRSYGLLGYVRMQLREHSVVEAKPDSALQDLRIAAPWPELADYCAAVDLAKLDSKAHSHTPYVVLLVQAVAAWKAAHGGSPPTTFAEKTQFKEAVKAMSRDIQVSFAVVAFFMLHVYFA
jgi:NEDD8-activating enzyme E1 regulatory subunit